MKSLAFVFLFVLAGCITSPKEHANKILSLDRSQVLTREKAAATAPAISVKINDRTKGWLEEKDPIFFIDEKTNERSFFKVASFTAAKSEQIIEVHTQAHKGIGFGSIGIIYPYVAFFDDSAFEIKKDIENLFFDYANTFMDGRYLRAVYKLNNLKPGAVYRVLVGSKTMMTGKGMGSVTNYAGAGAGIFLQSGVQVSPVGPFWVLQADSFKK